MGPDQFIDDLFDHAIDIVLADGSRILGDGLIDEAKAKAKAKLAASEKQLAETEGWDDIDPAAVEAFISGDQDPDDSVDEADAGGSQ